jgi:ATPase subunit of ABC transporter with duplicated ATPase domains
MIYKSFNQKGAIMKTINNILGSILLSVFLLPVSAIAQDDELTNREKRKLKKQEKKEQREARLEAKSRLNQQLIESRKFVLEADQLSNRYGESAYVSSNLNFILVDSGEAVIQIGSHSGMGANGVGGVTAEGKITKYEVTNNEKRNTTSVEIMVTTALGMYEVRFYIMSGTRSTAELTSAVRGGNLTFHGDIKPIQAASIYQGHTVY